MAAASTGYEVVYDDFEVTPTSNQFTPHQVDAPEGSFVVGGFAKRQGTMDPKSFVMVPVVDNEDRVTGIVFNFLAPDSSSETWDIYLTCVGS